MNHSLHNNHVLRNLMNTAATMKHLKSALYKSNMNYCSQQFRSSTLRYYHTSTHSDLHHFAEVNQKEKSQHEILEKLQHQRSQQQSHNNMFGKLKVDKEGVKYEMTDKTNEPQQQPQNKEQQSNKFKKSLENSRDLMCNKKRHDVLLQQKSEYFLYL
ncbi:hypothetical protein C9374_003721 [Naegleria lovaniensis]|uniref:Uncharacterized protein n=1 Tax=Naegleria lovaniensis TaxID=51637 RepID=A0AA88H863_NAELO|nr:uncharacterized protein C9374_003721 [Naegleria lovaniensis]KAG2393957.1 hypothetical protein C9374_003721 [Naegleria lovaniensis]